MATKRKVVKKDIKRDPLVTYALKVSRYTQDHFNQVIIGVVVLIAAISAVVFMTNSRRSSAVQSERQLSQALALYQQRDFEAAKTTFAQVSSRFGGRNGVVAQYYKAECELNQRNYSQALMDYDAYLNRSSKFPEFKVAAMYGSALAHEGLENYALAAAEMEKAHQALDEDDPRYLESAFKAGELFATAGDRDKAAHYFRLVADNASGNLKDRASVAVALLDAR